jgi:uroporphyrinogen-III decarboxylase
MKDSTKVVRQALGHEKPDRLPIFINNFWEEFTAKWRREKNLPPETAIEDYYGNDLAVLVAQEELWPTRKHVVRQAGEDKFVDDGWGRVLHQKPGTGIGEAVEHVLTKASDLDKIKFDSPLLDLRYTDFVHKAASEKAKGRPVFVKIGGPFIRSSFFRGETEFLMDLAMDEGFARAVVDRVGEHLLAVGLESLRRAGAHENGLWIYDDMCNSNAPMFSPATFEKIFLPVYKRMVSSLKKAGTARVILHCDGNVRPFLEMLIEAGIDGINPVEYSAGLHIPELMEQYRGKLAFIGGVCNTRILPSNNADHIAEHVRAIAQAGRDGGLIIGTHSIGPDISVANMDLFYRIVRQING